MYKPSPFMLRIILVALVVTYGLTLYIQWHSPKLSLEAAQYQQIAATVMSGLSIGYAMQKLCWLLGNIAGVLGVVLMFLRSRIGLFLLLACPSLLIGGAIMGAPGAAYPAIMQTTTMILWCVTSAIWGCAVTYALVGDKSLFSNQIGHNPATG